MEANSLPHGIRRIAQALGRRFAILAVTRGGDGASRSRVGQLVRPERTHERAQASKRGPDEEPGCHQERKREQGQVEGGHVVVEGRPDYACGLPRPLLLR